MASAHLLRLQIEAALADRIPSALTPAPRVIRPTAPTGIAAIDDQLGGGLPIGAITELAGPECSGRTSLALSFIAGLTTAGHVCAWVDVSDTLHPESAAAIGVDLARLLWIRCGPEAQQHTLPGLFEKSTGKFPGKQNVSVAVISSGVLHEEPPLTFARCAEPQPTIRRKSREVVTPASPPLQSTPTWPAQPGKPPQKLWSRLDQALRVTDLLLQAGGFSAIVLDMGSIAPEFALRVPLATWFRYRATAERTHASVVLLTQHACTKSSAGLVLYCQPSQVSSEESTVLTAAEHRVEIAHERFGRFAKVVDFARRKPPQSDHSILWQSHSAWAGRK
jgi:hypothetical protein